MPCLDVSVLPRFGVYLPGYIFCMRKRKKRAANETPVGNVFEWFYFGAFAIETYLPLCPDHKILLAMIGFVFRLPEEILRSDSGAVVFGHHLHRLRLSERGRVTIEGYEHRRSWIEPNEKSDSLKCLKEQVLSLKRNIWELCALTNLCSKGYESAAEIGMLFANWSGDCEGRLASNCFDAWVNAGFTRELTHGKKDTPLLYNQLNLLYCLNQDSYLHNAS